MQTALKADSAAEKATRDEHKSAVALNDAAHAHDTALTHEKQAQHDAQVRFFN